MTHRRRRRRRRRCPARAADALAAAGPVARGARPAHAPSAGSGDHAVEIRLAELRYAAFAELPEAGLRPTWPVATPTASTAAARRPSPRSHAADLTAEAVRRQRSRARAACSCAASSEPHRPLRRGHRHRPRRPQATAATPWHPGGATSRSRRARRVASAATGWPAAAGCWPATRRAARHALRRPTRPSGCATSSPSYLGERPVLSANKCTLRRVPLDTNTDWHQDGAFLGEGIRALNVWIALTECGVDSPGMDLVPKRFDAVRARPAPAGPSSTGPSAPTPSPAVAAEAPPVRPRVPRRRRPALRRPASCTARPSTRR